MGRDVARRLAILTVVVGLVAPAVAAAGDDARTESAETERESEDYTCPHEARGEPCPYRQNRQPTPERDSEGTEVSTPCWYNAAGDQQGYTAADRKYVEDKGGWPASTATRISYELTGGVLGTGLGFGLGALIGMDQVEGESSDLTEGWAILGGSLGMLAGAPLGTYLGGYTAPGWGTFGATALGALVGSGAGLTYLFVRDDVRLVDMAAVPVLGIAGSMVGYEISHWQTTRNNPRFGNIYAEPTLRISPEEGTGVVGIRGRF